ncbi:MAG: DNA repair protein RecN [Alphaproteobacteria bacterium]
MLRDLYVRRLAVIEDLHVSFGPGLNVLTGETGAGKSILVTAIGLALGWRATAEMIRTGCRDAEIQAELEANSAKVKELLDELNLPVETSAQIRRLIQSTGRNKVEINERQVNLGDLRRLGETLINLYGQHEAQGLMRPEVHLELLDAYAGLLPEREKVAGLFVELKELSTRLRSLERQEAEREARQSYLRFVVEEIDGAKIKPGEDEELQAQRKVLAHAEALDHLAREVGEVLHERDGAVAEQAGVLLQRLEAKLELDPRLAPMVEGLRALVAAAEDVAMQCREYADGLDHDPRLLGEIEGRLEALRGLKKKYGGSLASVLETREKAEQELATLERLTDEIETAQKSRDRTAAELAATAKALSAARKKATKKMEKEVERELADLDMAGTKFLTPVEPLIGGGVELDGLRIDETGADQVEFLISPNIGESPRPLARIASGGELSRIMLAIKHVLSRHFPVPTLIFDEVDAGVGGAQAERLGRKLREVAREHQVLCITHLPQIAALADRHYAVRKTVDKGRTHTRVELLGEETRVEELARMLGGEKITAAAREAARALLADGSSASRQARQPA